MEQIRVRFAPSPTGNLHIGGARTALFNWLFARKNGGVFILRLEDTDLERNLEEAEAGIFNCLDWLGLNWDEGPGTTGLSGPYRQSERFDLYRKQADRLLESGAVYKCYCTPSDLAQQREQAQKKGLAPRYDGRCRLLSLEERLEREARGVSFVLRIKMPQEGTTVVHDLIRGTVEFENKTMDDFIVVKSNGLPTYNFACVVDDSLMHITHVIRAEEHLSNTPKQILLYRALGFNEPAFAHVPMILAPDRSKLSKRHGATSVDEFRLDGYFPEALVNYLALLGWSPGDDREMMTVNEIINLFSLEAISKSAAIYDIRKLTWLNAQYLCSFEPERVAREVVPFLQARGYIKDDPDEKTFAYIKKVSEVVRTRVHTLVELADASSYFYVDDFEYDEKGVKKFFNREGTAELLDKGRETVEMIPCFDLSSVELAYRNLIENLGISGGSLIHPTRLALSGKTMGPGLFDIMVTLGKEKCAERLEKAVCWLRKR